MPNGKQSIEQLRIAHLICHIELHNGLLSINFTFPQLGCLEWA